MIGIETSKNVCKELGEMEGASSLLARSINRYMSFLRSIGPSCMELNLALTNSFFCDFSLMGDFLFKNIGKKRAKTCLLKKLPLPLQSKNGVLAHLARARHWQCRGERFESAILHHMADLEAVPSLLLFLMQIIIIFVL